jgi:outer membrane lipoprotein LolB
VRRLLLAGLVLWLAGCAVAPERPPVSDPNRVWQSRKPLLLAIHAWQISGKLGLRTAKESNQASLIWERSGQAHKISLFGPLGAGKVLLSANEQGATLRDAKKKTYTASDPQSLLYQTTGWRIPIGNLVYWLAGVPAPDRPRSFRLDAWGRLEELEQSGWKVRFLDYLREGELELPRKVHMTYPVPEDGSAPEEGSLEVRLVIKRWGLKS